MKSSQSIKQQRPTTRVLAIAGAAMVLMGAGQVMAQSDPVELGVWYNHTGKGAVQVYRCMQDPSRLCGRIVWLKKTTNAKGEPLTDGRNPKASLRGRQICGLAVLGNLQPSQGGEWKGGWVYDPEKGASYTASIRAKTRDVLTMTGYKGIFFKSHSWKRAPPDLPRCGELEPVTAAASAG